MNRRWASTRWTVAAVLWTALACAPFAPFVAVGFVVALAVGADAPGSDDATPASPTAAELLAEGRRHVEARRFDDARTTFARAAAAARAEGDASAEAEALARLAAAKAATPK